MLAIIVSACLAGDPANCKDYRIPLDSSIDPTKCVMHAPPHVAKWADEHPNLVITKFLCRPTNENDI
jgi:hypothetical protein